MSFSEQGNSDPTLENVEQEDKVKVEEASVNLDCVKRELDEEVLEFEHKQYNIALTFENIFGESSTQQRSNRDSLIGFLDGDVIMETGSIKLEDVKDENKDLIRKTIEQSHCNKCGGNYQGYCLNCSSLSHILNNITLNLNPEPVSNTTPINVFEIREVSRGCAVFALKTLPKGIILGPFEGIVPIESTTGLQWKIKDRKLVNDQNGNWMKYIASVANPSSRNLDVFQIHGILYFETSRDIQEGEELLVCYGTEEKEEMLKSDKEEVFYLVPVKKEEYPKVFACTLCCLGFRLESCLLEHKSKCPQGDHGVNVEDFKIIQCRYCKVWLEKEEHLGSHMLHCLDNYNRSCRNRNPPNFAPTTTDNEEQVHENDEITTSIDVNANYSTPPTEIIDSSNCSFRTDFKVHKEEYFHDKKNMETTHSNTNNLKSHTKHFQCDVCKLRFGRKSSLKVHIQKKHSNTNEKEYKCSECSYQTNHKGHLKIHLVSHTHVKDFQCDICKQRFGQKSNLKVHIKNQHSNKNEKEYKCSECCYQTNRKGDLKIHFNTHTGIKNFQCNICKQRFGQKSSLPRHIQNKHSNALEMEYKCSACSFQTIYKGSLNIHTDVKNFQCDLCKQRFTQKGSLIMHIKDKHSNTNEKEYKCTECSFQTNQKSNTAIKYFYCDICKQRFTEKGTLQRHIKNKHSNTTEKEYKCSECSYQTNRKDYLKRHLNTHNDIKHFQCDICKQRCSRKSTLIMHIKNKHSNTNEKEYKCSECSYQTNDKGSLKKHLVSHTGVKDFECDICKQRFAHKITLKVHMKNQHSNTKEKEYKCTECSYQTIYKGNLNIHLSTHSGVKNFQCDLCKQRFTLKSNLKVHIQNKHSNTNEKEYKCSKCFYETNRKDSLKCHLDTHSDIKHFQCDICKQRFGRKDSLQLHTKNQHSNTNEKEYKCSECSYETNSKSNFRKHLSTHI